MRRLRRAISAGLVPALLCLLPVPGLADEEETSGHSHEQSHEHEDEHAHEHEHEHGETETIVVTHSPLEHERDELALPVNRLDREDILRNLGTTLGDTLRDLPGVTTTGFAAGASRPVIRGQDAFRTGVLEDGLPTQDVSRESPDHGVPVNPLTAERIEVVRGPATLRYGGGASGGVVNAITRRVPDRRPDDFVTGEILGAIDTVAEARDVAFTLDGGTGPVAWHLDGLLRQTNDYEIPNDGEPDTQNGTFTDAVALSAGGAWLHERGRLGFSYSRFENEYGIPEEGEDVFIDMKTDRFRFEGDLYDPLPGVREVRVRGVWSDYLHDEVAEGEVGQTYDNEEFDGRVELLHEPVAGFVGAVGLQGGQRQFEARGEASEFLAPFERRTVAVYVFEERPLADRLTLEAGLRVESTRAEGTPAGATSERERDFVPVSGSLGLVADVHEAWTLGLTGNANQRAPAGVELFARGPHEATRTFEIGDPDLDEETSYGVELRATGDYDRVRVEAAAFYRRFDDYIVATLTGNTVDEEGDPVAPGDPEALDELVYDERGAVFYGTELAVEADLLDALAGTFGADGQFDFVRARFTGGSGDRDLPRITPIRWGAGVFYRGTWLEGRLGFLRTEAQEDLAAFETRTDDYTYLNASVTARVGLLEDRVPVEVTLAARNLTDVRGRNHVAFNKDEVLLPGRNVRVGVRARF